MRAALKTRRRSGGKWFSLIDRCGTPRLLKAAWERLDGRVKERPRRSRAGVDGVTVERFAGRAMRQSTDWLGELKAGTYRHGVRASLDTEAWETKKRPWGCPVIPRQSRAGGAEVADRADLRE